MKVLSVNTGSSTLKIQLFEMPEGKVLISALCERIGNSQSFYTINLNGEKTRKEAALNTHEDAVNVFLKELIDLKIINKLEEIDAVGHRVLHGFDKYSQPTIIDEEVIKDIDSYAHLGPLHNPANLLGIKAVKAVLSNTINVAVFDTAFHQTMAEEAYIYPVPYEWYEKYGVRKYGFHGTSHKYISESINRILNRQDLKVISCHLGSGSSICAIKNGKSIDTSMGLTPLAGIPMGTRSGDIDVSIIEYIMRETGRTINEVTNDLNKNSGLLGISGVSGDARDIQEEISKGNKRCILARNIFVRKIASYIAQYYVLLDGIDVLVFTAGIGENDTDVRREVINRLKSLGVKINDDINNITIRKKDETLISTDDSSFMCYVIPTNEELMIAQEAYNLSH